MILGLSLSIMAYFAMCYFAFGQQALMRDVAQRLRPGGFREPDENSESS